MMYQLYLGPGTVYVEDPLNEDIFDSGLSYVKASWILHMLRHIVGDEIFFDILRAYYHSAGNQYGTATTADFQAVCEQVSGLDLDKFFHQWVYEDSYPHYALSWDYERRGSQYEITLDILQEQENYAFWMPLDVMVMTEAGERNFVIWDSLAQQSFVLNVDARPESIELDPHDWVLKKVRGDFQNPSFDQGILLVNGIDWDTYRDEVLDAYENRAFWGDFPISFWDCFYPSAQGYPSTLPEPLGRGRVPAPMLGQFSTVIWIGNNYNGDLGSWQLTPIMEYIRAGGNVLLLGRRGQDFIDEEMREYLGIQWMEYPMMDIHNCMADVGGLLDMEIVGTQSLNALFSSYLSNAESTLLFRETASNDPAAGIGVWHHPAEGGSHRVAGAQFVFISGRPYRYDSAQLRSNIEYILGEFLGESKTAKEPRPTAFRLQQNYPNPFNRATAIRYQLDRAMDVRIAIYDLCGNRIRVMLNREAVPAGSYEIFWDGRNDEGVRVASGVYLYELQSSRQSTLRKMLLMK